MVLRVVKGDLSLLFWVPEALMQRSVLRKALNNWRMLHGAASREGGFHPQPTQRMAHAANQNNAGEPLCGERQ